MRVAAVAEAVRRRPRREAALAMRVVAYLAAVAAVGGAYYAAGWASLALQYRGPVAAIWLPAGVGAAGLYLGGLRLWPGVFLADVALADPAQPVGSALALTAGNIADVLVIAILLRRALGSRGVLDRRERVGGLLVAVLVGAAITATVATLSLRVGDVVQPADTPTFSRSWFLADACGSLIVIPLVLAWTQPLRVGWRARRAWEGALMIAAVVALSAIALSADRSLPYLVFPALIWGAVRFGQRGGTLAVAVTSGMAVAITAAEVGPFVAQEMTDAALGTQLYMAVAALTTLFLAAIVSERQRALVELAKARGRIVAAADVERRRIERNLHDGPQQRLTLLGVKLEAANELAGRDPAAVRPLLGELGAELEVAVDEVRALASGIFPPVLADFGLADALRALARSAPVGARVVIDGTERCRPEVEAAVYFCCSEALHNAAKHAGAATTVSVSLRHRRRDLHFEVSDGGSGFSVADVRSGQGLVNMRDRIEAVGGTVEIRSAPGRGTRVIGTVPCA